MNITSDQGTEEVEVDMTPMIDVTFLLLIFFVIISTLTRLETEAEVVLPIAEQAQVEDAPDVNQLVINVESDEDIFILGAQCNEQQIAALLKREADKSREKGTPWSNQSIVIRGHGRTPYSRIQWLMKQCLSQGIWKLHLAALQEPPKE